MVLETEYHTAAHLNTMREKSQHVREEEAMMVGRCLAQSLTQSPKDGLLVVGERDADALVLRARSHGSLLSSMSWSQYAKWLLVTWTFSPASIGSLHRNRQGLAVTFHRSTLCRRGH